MTGQVAFRRYDYYTYTYTLQVAFRRYDYSADVYSYAVCLYELLHLRPFMPAKSALVRLQKLIDGHRPPAALSLAGRPRQASPLRQASSPLRQPSPALDDDGELVRTEARFASAAAETIEACWQLAWERRPAMAQVVKRLHGEWCAESIGDRS